ncbi:MAG: hypothetical protein BWY54_00912 [Candidatus Dependentiae bacterium ADurb.Bin331]|nr:MAG: hypothetical protein BWY54_00912 [Candidatus Dependentiae bacterium ADurb.Bin331]
MNKQSGIELYDLYDWWYQPFWYHPIARIVGWLLVSGLILIMFFFLYRLLKKRAAQKTREPWQDALSELQGIKLILFEDPETHKIFYAQLTALLKTYLGKRYGLALNDKTDHEVIEQIACSPLPVDLQEHVRALFQGAQLIKFAHQEGAQDRMRFDLMRAIDIVRNTIPKK